MRWIFPTTVLLGVLSASSADAHIRMVSPPARYVFEGQTGENQKIGPCASGTASGEVTVYEPGQEITVSWNEIIDHPGHFRVAFDPTGQDAYDDPSSENDMAVAGNVVAYVADDGSSNYSHTFTLPDEECDPCSIQVMQVMTDKLPWGPAGGDDIYYWCSDIVIQEGGSSSGSGGSTSSGNGGSTSSGAGGSNASGTGGAFSPADGDPAASGEDDGCGCKLAGAERGSTRAPYALIASTLLLFAWRRAR